MIYITVGTQKFQFNRLFEKIDNYKKEGHITQEIFAQIGSTTYRPKYYEYKDYISREDHQKFVEKASIYICHGGTSSIIEGLKLNKKTMVVPRNNRYGEHVDNHQLEISQFFYNQGYIELIENIDEEFLSKCTKLVNSQYKHYPINKESKLSNAIIDDIENYIGMGNL